MVNKSTPKHPFPWPLKGDCTSRQWTTNYAAEAPGRAMQDLYDNTNGMLDDLAEFWRQSALVFANNSAVLGCVRVCKRSARLNEPCACVRAATCAIVGAHALPLDTC